jgi:transcriptional regulator with PAS, ATPase and Fis domain
LIIGDSGTGKELIATNIHYKSERRYEAFITINCAAIPKDLIESELFGYERGAFTGAVENKPGLFEQANGGTLFLDEITELSSPAQAKLFKGFTDGEIDKIGRQKKYNVYVRVIAATNRRPDELLKNNILREDLFYRLNILQIQVPSLKERLGDIPLLVQHFIDYYCREMGRAPLSILPDAMRVLENYAWPGNVRQLKNIVQRMVILAGESGITKELVDTSMGGVVAMTPSAFTSPDLSLKKPDRSRKWKRNSVAVMCDLLRSIPEQIRRRRSYSAWRPPISIASAGNSDLSKIRFNRHKWLLFQ